MTGVPTQRPLDYGRQPALVSRSVHPDHILHLLLLAPCSLLGALIMSSTGQVLAFAVPWIATTPPAPADIQTEIDEKMFAINYELSYISR